ncbi:hypothetical protein ACFL6Q_02265 [Candidatus Neomarinimicrobiota bacterium]
MARIYTVDERFDEFENWDVYEQKYNSNGDWNLEADFLNIRIIKPAQGELVYSLIVYKEGSDVWLYTATPLQIKANDEIQEFEFLNERSNVLAATNVQKWGYYLADRASIEKILAANRVVAKVYTTEGFYTVEYHEDLLNRIREFMAKYAD